MSKALIEPINPATGESLPGMPAASAAEVADAIKRSRAAFSVWSQTTVADRAELLIRVADALESRAAKLGEVITAEMGRVLAESVPEVTKSASFFRYFARIAAEALTPTTLDLTGMTLPEKEARVFYEPRGVAAVIKPWNAPVQQIVWALAPALAAGCTAIIKPSEFTPASGLGLQEAFEDAGFPTDVVITLPGDDNTGRALVEGDVDVVAFTGSVASGREVAKVVGGRLRKAILELSGKDSLIVDKGVSDLELVTSGIVYGAFSNCGHWCSSIERVFLPAERWDELLSGIIEKTRLLRVGPGNSDGVDIGPVANERQFDIVSEIVADALHRGAKALTGGEPLAVDGRPKGLFYSPTILVDVPQDARLTNENVFGPVVAIEMYTDINDAVARANTTNYGLGLSVWTDDPDFARLVTRKSETGMVWVNEPLQSLAACPWSAYKDSGIGVELGVSGLREFTYEKVVQSQFDGNNGPRSWYFPYK